jgi:hypothetical protein
MTWAPGSLVTERDTSSHRFPCIIDRMVAGTSEDTVCVLYLSDQVAGFFTMDEGPATPNPVICQFIPNPLDAVADTQCIQEPGIYRVIPTIVRGVLFLPEASSRKAQAASLLDAVGRKVMELHAGPNDTRSLAPGVYFVREEPHVVGFDRQAIRKVLVVR